jgi:O-methyltransferase involved in polyketide biosynthesis
MGEKIKIELGKVQETLLLPLWGRAVESQKKAPRFVDKKAVEIINKIDYDFSVISGNIRWISQYSWVVRSIHIDRIIHEFIKGNPKATIVNIGCGLDTIFDRVDNGQILFYEIDLPDVINLRKKLFEDHERRKLIATSFLEPEWLSELNNSNGLLFLAAGVFYYFKENEIKNFFIRLADRFPGSEILFDAVSPMGAEIANKKVIKDGGMDETAILKWGIKNPRLIEKWDSRIHLVNEFRKFKGMKKGLPLKRKYSLWMSDLFRIMYIVHLRISK